MLLNQVGNKARALVVILLSVGVSSCGSRSSLKGGTEDASQCEADDECDLSNLCAPQGCVDGECQVVDEVDCSLAPECHSSSCDPSTGRCVLFPLTEDVDGDGARAPLVGFSAGAPGSCGTDCNDANPLAYPGGIEVCDGADNDCDGIIDNGSDYLGFREGEFPRTVKIASEAPTQSARRGIAYGDGVYVVGFWATIESQLPYIAGLSADGSFVFPQTSVSHVNAQSFGPTLAWAGDAFGAAWNDNRLGNHEIYFARFDRWGEKLGPDLPVTEGEGNSVHPRMIMDQGRYVIVWDDARALDESGRTTVFAQLVSREGTSIGQNVALTTEDEYAEYPYIAATDDRFGIAYTVLSNQVATVRFRTFDKTTLEGTDFTVLSATDARGPRVAALGDYFVATWDVLVDQFPGESIMAAVVSETGQIITGPQPITTGGRFSRSHSTISLGDRFVLLWSDYAYGNYEISAKVLDLNLRDLEPSRRLTDTQFDTFGVEAALGEDGRIGIVFDDYVDVQEQHAHFLSLGCQDVRLF